MILNIDDVGYIDHNAKRSAIDTMDAIKQAATRSDQNAYQLLAIGLSALHGNLMEMRTRVHI